MNITYMCIMTYCLFISAILNLWSKADILVGRLLPNDWIKILILLYHITFISTW